MQSRDFLSQLELLALLDVARLPGSAYGAQIARDIAGTSKRTVARASVYAALGRLEKKGLVRSTLSAATAKRGGKARTLYTVTARGLQAAYDAKSIIAELSKGLPPLRLSRTDLRQERQQESSIGLAAEPADELRLTRTPR